jgi:radical SAM superfamily enzyme YgiQ (UPF0313 family)
MKVVLINPPTSFEQIYGDWDLSSVDTYCPPIGLLYIASFIRKHNHDPYVIDVTANKWSLKQVVEFASSLNPGVVGISAKTVNILNANNIAEQLKRKGISAPIVVGGAHITALPQETLRRFKSIDYGVIGEGEVTFLELIEKVVRNESIADVKSTVWRNDIREIVVNPARPLVEDLDVLPLPAWDLLPNFPKGYRHSALETKRLPAASVITSRGCPFHCTFCDNAIFGSIVRHHSAEYTLNMIRHLKEKYGIKDLMILDDNFLLDKKKLFQICETIVEEKMDLSWYCLSHAKFMTEERLRKIREAGCWFIEIGIESGCDRILKFIKKNTTKAEVEQAVKRARAVGLKVKGNFIFGFPTETRDSLEETIQFATHIDLSYFQQNFLTIWPGCKLSIDPERYGNFEPDWSKLAHQRVTFVPHGLTQEDLIKASKDAFRRFYWRPKTIFEMLTTLTSFRAIQTAMVAFVVFLKTILRKSS